MRILLPAALIALLAGCSSAEERLCRTEIDKTLLNPETAIYSDYTSLSADQVKGDRLMSAFADILKSQPGTTYSTMKLRVEGKLGNTITSRQFCAYNAAKTSCSCVSGG